ncbi:MAG TPA: HAMP domain-containing sensor histidine kinase [Bacillales bacterium]|nr:HAMP domain-containing sensor histidine kinase [Bacillales bacterium]
MLYIMMISVVVAAAVLVHLYFIKKELKAITGQLQQVNLHKSEKKIDLAFYDKDIESLVIEINRELDLVGRANAEKRRSENELKQAVANISHDLRTPLTSILGYIQLLGSDEITPEERQEYLTIIQDRTRRLQALIVDFFELSVIESTDYHLNPERIKMNSVVLDTLMSFYDQFNEQHIEPSIQMPEEDLWLTADESAVKRVIENLALNAIRHSSGQVRIQLEKQVSAIILTISNDADNLTPHEVDKLFDRFYMADQNRSGKGTGLGLSIAKELMRKMYGELSAELQNGQLHMKCLWNFSAGPK